MLYVAALIYSCIVFYTPVTFRAALTILLFNVIGAEIP